MFDKRLMQMCPESKKYILGNILLQFLELCLSAAMIVTIAVSVQRLYDKTWAFEKILLPILAVIATVAVRFFTAKHAVRMSYLASRTVKRVMRERIYGKLLRLGASYREHTSTAELVQESVEGVEQLEVFYAHTVAPVCIAVLTELVMVFFIGSWHWLPGLLALLVFLTVGVVLPFFISRRSGSLGDEMRADNGALAAYMLESIRGLDETVQYGGGARRLAELTEKTKALSEKQGRLSALTGTNLALTNTLILGFDLAMFALCTLLYTRHSIGIDGFIVPLVALMSSFGPVTALASLGTTLQTTVASGARVLAILDEEPETEDICGREPVVFSGAGLEHVSFSYGGEAVLRDLSLALPENRIIGIVGKSGCGKSTLLKLLMCFWKTDAGVVSVSGRSVEDINTADLRDMESYMTQETQLFKDSIAGNLRIAKPDASQEELEAACKKASIHDFILTLPKGYETELGELGETLSGGERQRLGLARAFLHDAPFLLLDEPTSNLDSLNEAVILKSLKEEAAGKAVVLVSHRASTVRIADEVISMESGRVS